MGGLEPRPANGTSPSRARAKGPRERDDIYTHQGLGRAGYVVIVSYDGFKAITGHSLTVRVNDRPDLTETLYVVALSSADPVPGYLES